MRFKLILITFILSATTATAQKDSFWLRNLNLMGAPKAVFALDDGHSIVLADSFDMASGKYKGIIFFKINPNGKTIKRQQIAKIDKHLLEQKVERVDKLADYILIKSYHLLDNDSSRKHYIFYKINFSGEILNSFQENIQRYWIVGDTLIQHIHWEKVLYRNLNDFSVFDSIYYKEAISWYFLNENENTFTEIYAKNIKDKYDSVVIIKRTLKLDTLRFFSKLINIKELIRPRPTFKFLGDDYLFLSYKNELVKTDTNLNILWQTPPEYVEANIQPYVKDVRVLRNDDILVIADADNTFARVPYASRISADGKLNYFKYHYPSPLDKYYDFDEGPKGEFFLLSGSRLSQPADSVWLIKSSRFGRTNSIIEPMNDGFFSLYPNPAQDELHIEFAEPTKGHLCIYNSAGRLVSEQKFGRETTMQLNVAHLPPGNYLLKVQDHKGQIYTQLFNH